MRLGASIAQAYTIWDPLPHTPAVEYSDVVWAISPQFLWNIQDMSSFLFSFCSSPEYFVGFLLNNIPFSLIAFFVHMYSVINQHVYIPVICFISLYTSMISICIWLWYFCISNSFVLSDERKHIKTHIISGKTQTINRRLKKICIQCKRFIYSIYLLEFWETIHVILVNIDEIHNLF